MTQQAQTTTTPVAPPPAELPTLQQRTEVIHEQIREEGLTASEPAADAAAAVPPTTTASPADSAAAKAKPDDPAARSARLAEMRKQEAERVERSQRLAAQADRDKEFEVVRKRAEDAEARAKKLVDFDALDEASFFRLAQQKGIAPQKLAEFIRESMANPERVAEAAALDAAKRAVDPEIKAMREELAALKKRDDDREQAFQAAQHQRAEQQAAGEFFKFTSDNAGASPRSAAFLNQFGGDEFYKLALQASKEVPPGAGWQPILDVIEDNLTSLAAIYAPPTTDKSQGKAPPPRSAAAKATNTVTNSLAQERASVVEDADWSDLPFDERVARMKR